MKLPGHQWLRVGLLVYATVLFRIAYSFGEQESFQESAPTPHPLFPPAPENRIEFASRAVAANNTAGFASLGFSIAGSAALVSAAFMRQAQ